MVRTQIQARGIRDPRVLEAMLSVPRHRFVRPGDEARAYGDHPLPIGFGQTISQPYIVAKMTELLAPEPDSSVLEIGAGSGYQTAILARLSRQVFAVERIPALADRARRILEELGYENVQFHVRDGTLGLPDRAPFDRILVAAAAPEVPAALLEQLAEGGRLVIPVGNLFGQQLVVYERRNGRLQREEDILCRFVPLVGAQGWPVESD